MTPATPMTPMTPATPMPPATPVAGAAVGLPVDPAVQLSIERFLAEECLALDERRFRDWLAMFADDARYEVPVRVTREADAEWDLSPRSRIFDDDKRTLEIRIRRLETDFAWAEQPPSRTRHHLSNILVDAADAADAADADGETGGADGAGAPAEYLVRSNCLIYRSRGDRPAFDLVSVQRRDTVRREGGGWLFARRWAAIDQSTVGVHNLSFFL
jgi:PAH dioxygenase small subunit